MEVRFQLTKYRVALAALFVLAGVGLGNLLSPLVGTALATVGQTVNISDHSAAAYFAKVDSSGKLAVGDGGGSLTVDGAVTASEATPKNLAALTLAAFSSAGGTCFPVSFPTGKALIITSIFADLSVPPSQSSPSTFWSLRKGTTCSGPDIIADHPASTGGGKSIQLDPGFPVAAAAGGISLVANSSTGNPQFGVATYVYGYWVPASAV